MDHTLTPSICKQTITINVARQRVWRAISEPEQLTQWLLPPALGAQIQRDHNDLLVNMFGMAIPLAVLEIIEPENRLVFRSLPDRASVVTLALTSDNGNTRVTATLSGFAHDTADMRSARQSQSALGWERALANLNAHITHTTLPFPEGYVAALFGFRRETKALFSVERSIWIKAPRPRVWQAVTDPKQMQQWFSPNTVWTLTALAPGGRLFTRDGETDAEQYAQVVTIVDPPYHFAIRTTSEPDETQNITEYVLREEDGGTRLTVVHSGFITTPVEQRHAGMEQNAFGFGMMVANIKAFVEGQVLPHPGGF